MSKDLREYNPPEKKEIYTESGLGHMHWLLAMLVRMGVRFVIIFIIGMAEVRLSLFEGILISAADFALWIMLTKERYRNSETWKIYNWVLIIYTIFDFILNYME